MYITRLDKTAICAVLMTTAAITDAADRAAIVGRVVITKALTKKRITMPSYQLRGVTVDPPPPESSSRATPVAEELSRVVVYLEGAGLAPGSPTKAILAQKDRRFEPDLLVIPAGSTVSFPNEDPVFHNVFSLSKVKQFDLGYYAAGKTREVKFDKPGVVQVYCHLHADMSAAILVLPTALWTKLAADGSFSLRGVPPGTYELVAWHRFAGFFRRHVTLGNGETPPVDFVIPLKESDTGAAAAERER